VGLSHEVRIAADIPPRKASSSWSKYSTTSRPTTPSSDQRPHAKLGKGDVVAGALGHRQALFGYSGHVPADAAARGHHPDAQHRWRARGVRFHQPGERQAVRLPGAGVALNFPIWARHRSTRRVGHKALDANAALDTRGVPVWRSPAPAWRPARPPPPAPSSRMRHRGLTVDAFKATGVSLRRDILAMEDAGARRCAIFTDLGVRLHDAHHGPALTRSMLSELASANRRTAVRARRRHPRHLRGRCDPRWSRIRAALSSVILSANDPGRGLGRRELLRERFLIEPCAVTGPSTDNRWGSTSSPPDGRAGFQRHRQRCGARDRVIDALGLAATAVQ